MKNITLFFALIVSLGLSAQNFVQNGSFENRCGYPHIYYKGICHWKRPPNDGNTPDLFKNSPSGNCYPCSCFNGDHTFAGNTYAYDGKYFLGMLGYYIQGGQQNGRENIQTELSIPLEAGKTYFIGFALKFGSRSAFSMNNFGMYVSDSAVGPTNLPPNMDVILVKPQLDLGRHLPDSTGWTVMQAKYIANGGERFVTLGNFTPDSLLSVVTNPDYDTLSDGCLLVQYGAYYFIDDVFVYDSTSFNPMEIEDLHSNNDIMVYPNPADHQIVIKSYNGNSGNFQIWNQNGKLMMEDRFRSDEPINLGKLKAGVYNIRLSTETYNSMQKLILL